MIIAQSLNRYTCKYVSLYINIKERCFHRSIYFILEPLQAHFLLFSLLEATYEPQFH